MQSMAQPTMRDSDGGKTWMRSAWRCLVALGFRLLYNELAWLYDPVSWLASLGLWRRWQQTALQFLPPRGPILEVGFGPGHLLADLAGRGYRVVGLDLSAAMIRQAARRLQHQGLAVPICRGSALALPFAPETFEAVVVTFPTLYVYAPEWGSQLCRVLKPGGRAVIVEMTVFCRRDPAARGLESLYGLTGQRGPAPDLAASLEAAGLRARHESVEVEGSVVRLVVAEKANTAPA